MLTLLQQVQRGPGPGAGGPGAGDVLPAVVIVGVYLVAILIGLGIFIFFLLTLSKCFKEISPKNRQMEPGQVWLNLIPFFNYVWLILTILRLSDSLKDEYEDRGLRHDGDYGKTLGLMYYISLFVCPCATIVLYIMYWLKVAGFTNELRESGTPRAKRSKPRRDDDADADESDS